MAITMGQVPVSSLSLTVSAPLCAVPPGPAAVTIINGSGAALVVTAGVSATQTNGAVIPIGATVPFTAYPGSKGAALNVVGVTGGTLAGPVSWIISTAQ